jgi:hypothetical protein
MPEITAILGASREKEFNHNKFLAAMQGINLEEPGEKPGTTFDDIKARVFSGGQAKDASDIVSLQGVNAQQAGFGIGLGLEYTDAKSLENPSW